MLGSSNCCGAGRWFSMCSSDKELPYFRPMAGDLVLRATLEQDLWSTRRWLGTTRKIGDPDRKVEKGKVWVKRTVMEPVKELIRGRKPLATSISTCRPLKLPGEIRYLCNKSYYHFANFSSSFCQLLRKQWAGKYASKFLSASFFCMTNFVKVKRKFLAEILNTLSLS